MYDKTGKERILRALRLMDTSICHNKTLILMAAKLWALSKTLNKMAANISGFTVYRDCIGCFPIPPHTHVGTCTWVGVSKTIVAVMIMAVLFLVGIKLSHTCLAERIFRGYSILLQ